MRSNVLMVRFKMDLMVLLKYVYMVIGIHCVVTLLVGTIKMLRLPVGI